MKLALKILLAGVFTCGVTGVFGATGHRYSSTRGPEQVRLSEWASAQGLSWKWLKRDETLQLNGGATQIQLTVGSREARVNGVEVWLSFPPMMRDGGVSLTRLDIESTLKPLLTPPKGADRIRTICLDPGHGGKDPGNCVGSNQEKKYALLLAQEINRLLTREGFKVVQTRSGDQFIDLETRPDIAARRKADLFVSLHFNSAETGRDNVQGAQVFCMTPAGASSTNTRGEGGSTGWRPGNRSNDRSVYLAYQVQKALTRGLGSQDRGMRRARFVVLRDAVMPAVLVEAGFMSHPVEGRKIFSSAYRSQLAEAIFQGVKAYVRTVGQQDSRGH